MNLLQPASVYINQGISCHQAARESSTLHSNDWRQKSWDQRSNSMHQQPSHPFGRYGSLVLPGQEPSPAINSLDAFSTSALHSALPADAMQDALAAAPTVQHSTSTYPRAFGQQPNAARHAGRSYIPYEATRSAPYIPIPTTTPSEPSFERGLRYSSSVEAPPTLRWDSLESMSDLLLYGDTAIPLERRISMPESLFIPAGDQPSWMLADPVAAAPLGMLSSSPTAARHTPAASSSSDTSSQADATAAGPSRHLWLGNIPLKPSKSAMEECFRVFGGLDSVRVFPGKTYAFVNFHSVAAAIAAKEALDGCFRPEITGSRPMIIRFQVHPSQPPTPCDRHVDILRCSLPCFLTLDLDVLGGWRRRKTTP